MTDARKAQLAGSFGAAADAYERARPTYPDAAVDRLLPAGARDVLDLGAGTGKLTGALVARGLVVTAVEPLPEMLATLTAALPTVRALAGTAEAIPLPDASVDVVTVAQAWHWVDEARALPEVARVLRPGGTLALIWNIRDEGVEWVARLSALMGRSESERLLDGDVTIGPPFGPTTRTTFPWTRETDADGLVDLAASRSAVITAPEADRARILAAVRTLAETDPALAGHATFAMPYRTSCFTATRP